VLAFLALLVDALELCLPRRGLAVVVSLVTWGMGPEGVGECSTTLTCILANSPRCPPA